MSDNSWCYVHINGSKNALPTVRSIHIFESISQTGPTGTMVFQDENSLALDNEGFAKVEIQFGPSADNFSLYSFACPTMSLSGMPLATEPNKQPRKLSLIDNNLLQLMTKSYVKSFDGPASSAAESMVSDVFQNKLPKMNIETSVDTGKYIQPGWTNDQFLAYLVDNAVSQNSAGGYFTWFDYRYWEDDEDNYFQRFNFLTPTKMAKGSSTKVVYATNSKAIDEASTNGGRVDGDYICFGMETNYDSMFNIKEYQKTVGYFDLTTLTYKEETKNIDNIGLPKLGTESKKYYDPIYKLYSETGLNRISYHGVCDKINAVGNATRSIQRNYFKTSVSILMFGNLDILLGDMINLSIPMSKTHPFMTSLSGSWIVGRITHVLTFPQNSYVMKVTCYRDEYLGDI